LRRGRRCGPGRVEGVGLGPEARLVDLAVAVVVEPVAHLVAGLLVEGGVTGGDAALELHRGVALGVELVGGAGVDADVAALAVGGLAVVAGAGRAEGGAGLELEILVDGAVAVVVDAVAEVLRAGARGRVTAVAAASGEGADELAALALDVDAAGVGVGLEAAARVGGVAAGVHAAGLRGRGGDDAVGLLGALDLVDVAVAVVVDAVAQLFLGEEGAGGLAGVGVAVAVDEALLALGGGVVIELALAVDADRVGVVVVGVAVVAALATVDRVGLLVGGELEDAVAVGVLVALVGGGRLDRADALEGGVLADGLAGLAGVGGVGRGLVAGGALVRAGQGAHLLRVIRVASAAELIGGAVAVDDAGLVLVGRDAGGGGAVDDVVAVVVEVVADLGLGQRLAQALGGAVLARALALAADTEREQAAGGADVDEGVVDEAVAVVVEVVADLVLLAGLGRAVADQAVGEALGLALGVEARALVAANALLEEAGVGVGAGRLGVFVVEVDLAVAVVVDVIAAELDGGLARGQFFAVEVGGRALHLAAVDGVAVAVVEAGLALALELALGLVGDAGAGGLGALGLGVGEGVGAVALARAAGGLRAQVDVLVDLAVAVVVDTVAGVVFIAELLARAELAPVARVFIEVVVVDRALGLGGVVAALAHGAGDGGARHVLHLLGAVVVARAAGLGLGDVAVGAAAGAACAAAAACAEAEAAATGVARAPAEEHAAAAAAAAALAAAARAAGAARGLVAVAVGEAVALFLVAAAGQGPQRHQQRSEDEGLVGAQGRLPFKHRSSHH
jgi:hypothetical protein